MNFEHTEDRRMLSDMLRRFVAEQYDFATRMRHAQSPQGYSAEFWRRYAELGAIGALFAEADGGLGGAGFDISVVFEALGRGMVVEPFLDALMVGTAIAAAGSPAQREALDGLISGGIVAALAQAEPDSGYDLNQVRTRAERSDGGWVLNGAKAVVGAGDGELQTADHDFFAAHGQVSQFLNDQPADAVGFFAAVIRTEKGVDVFDFGCGVDAPAFGRNGVDIVGAIVFVKLVFDVADDLLDDVFKGYQARCAAVFVDDNRHVVALFAELF